MPNEIEPAEAELDLHAIQLEILSREAELLGTDGTSTSWLPEWYLGKVAEIEALLAKLDEQYHTMKSAIEVRRQVLQSRWGAHFKAQVDADLAAQGTKRRSVDYLTGRAGYRKKAAKINIVRDGEALQWALENTPEACSPHLDRKTPLLKHFKQTGEIPPGCEYVAEHDDFFPQIISPALTGQPAKEITNGSSDSDSTD